MCNCHGAIKSSKILISNANFHPHPSPSKGDICQGKKSYFPTLRSETKATCKFNIKVRSSYFNLNFRRRETEAPNDCSSNCVQGLFSLYFRPAGLGALYFMERTLLIHVQVSPRLISQPSGIFLLPCHSLNCFLEDHLWSFKCYRSRCFLEPIPFDRLDQLTFLPSSSGMFSSPGFG